MRAAPVPRFIIAAGATMFLPSVGQYGLPCQQAFVVFIFLLSPSTNRFKVLYGAIMKGYFPFKDLAV